VVNSNRQKILENKRCHFLMQNTIFFSVLCWTPVSCIYMYDHLFILTYLRFLVQINNFCWEYICWLLPIKLFQCKLDCQTVLILHNMFIFELVCQNFQWMLLLVSASFITALQLSVSIPIYFPSEICHISRPGCVRKPVCQYSYIFSKRKMSEIRK
jgi:hypothetical protein